MGRVVSAPSPAVTCRACETGDWLTHWPGFLNEMDPPLCETASMSPHEVAGTPTP